MFVATPFFSADGGSSSSGMASLTRNNRTSCTSMILKLSLIYCFKNLLLKVEYIHNVTAFLARLFSCNQNLINRFVFFFLNSINVNTVSVLSGVFWVWI